MEAMESLIAEIQKFGSTTTYEPASKEDVEQLEKAVGYSLPKDFKAFLRQSNGLIIFSDMFYGIYPDNPGMDLYSVFVRETSEVGNPMWDYLLPVHPDGFGNHYCLDLKSSRGDSCNIVFWQYDYVYNADDKPDIDSDSFREFLSERFDEIKEDLGEEPGIR